MWRGLVRLGYEQQAATLARAITETVSREGLREFYDPHDGRGMGAEDFAWSALALELLDPSNASVGLPAGVRRDRGRRSVPAAVDPSAQEHHARRRAERRQSVICRASALKLAGYLLVAYLVLKLIPALKQALHSLEHVSWEWLLGAIALEVLSETGFVVAWRAIVDPQKRARARRPRAANGRACRLGTARRRTAAPRRLVGRRGGRSAGSCTASECRRS